MTDALEFSRLITKEGDGAKQQLPGSVTAELSPGLGIGQGSWSREAQ